MLIGKEKQIYSEKVGLTNSAFPFIAFAITEVICFFVSYVRYILYLGWTRSSIPKIISPRSIIAAIVSGVREKPLGGTGHGLWVIGWTNGWWNLGSVRGSGALKLTLWYTLPLSSMLLYDFSPPSISSFEFSQLRYSERKTSFIHLYLEINSFTFSKIILALSVLVLTWIFHTKMKNVRFFNTNPLVIREKSVIFVVQNPNKTSHVQN